METLDASGNLLRNNLRFLSLWLQRPARLGAVMPSSRSLAVAMAADVDPAAAGAVVELGGGTGNITAALLETGIAARDIVVIEREPSLCRVIAKRFPEIRVICGDATKLRSLLRAAGVGPIKAVVSGLPLLSIPKKAERMIVAQAFAVLARDGVLIQFTYGPKAPVSRPIATALGILGERSHWVLDNLPPAAVWRYRRLAAAKFEKVA
jgi:phosphatidylethanolamine/phosphatidyl-N-methylethanolamine N-methyltransferase